MSSIRLSIRLVAIAGLLAHAGTRAQEPKRPDSPLDAYRRAVLNSAGDVEQGRALFADVERTQCAGCHAVGAQGPTIGPNLASLGGGRANPGEILASILEPSAKIHPDYQATVVALKSGQVVQGLVRPVGAEAIEVVTSARETVRVAVADIDEQTPSRVSVMPAGLNDVLTPAEMADLIAYLGAIEPQGTGSLREPMLPREIPHARVPIAFRPILEPAQAFHRPVWFGPVPGQAGTSVVVEIERARLWLLEGRGADVKKTRFVDLIAETTPGELTGITSVAFHPDFARNGRYFLKMHAPRGPGLPSVQIVERRAAADRRSDSGEPSKVLLTIPVDTGVHNGGHLAFGPDGFLYIGMGDTGPQGDPRGHGQDPTTLLGKLLRIDVDRAEGDRPYAIPADNPFRDRPGTLPEIWASGFREPWRFSFDPLTRDLWVGDVGQGLYEEVAIVRAGENHGWNVLEGFQPFSDRFARAGDRYTAPIFAYHHRVGVSITGGFVYRGNKSPALAGKYICGDFETRRVWAIEQVDRGLTSLVEIGRSPERIASFGVDEAGELYFVGLDRGLIYALDATGADLTPVLAPVSRPVVATSRQQPQTWRHTETAPAADWFRPDFDDSAWPEARGGFGTRGTPGSVVRTEWRSADLWLRRPFPLPEGLDLATLRLLVHHDEDAEIYLNGVLAARLPGFGSDYDEVPISAEARAALRPGGSNVLAVHCHQNRGGQYIDVGLVELRPPAVTAGAP